MTWRRAHLFVGLHSLLSRFPFVLFFVFFTLIISSIIPKSRDGIPSGIDSREVGCTLCGMYICICTYLLKGILFPRDCRKCKSAKVQNNLPAVFIGFCWLSLVVTVFICIWSLGSHGNRRTAKDDVGSTLKSSSLTHSLQPLQSLQPQSHSNHT